jgi:hypothetical protein
MHPSPKPDPRSPSSFGGTTTRAVPGADNDTAQPSLTSGFGAVMEKEHELQRATEGYLGEASGPRSADIERTLRHQQTRLAANIALLEQRYEMLPHPSRFQALQGAHAPLNASRRSDGQESMGALPGLVAQHRSLAADIDGLIAGGADGQRGELILTEVGRNHDEMASMLTALLHEDDPVRGPEPVASTVAAAPAPGTTEGGWENEGGARAQPSAPPHPLA